jgi:hypothetical protein
MGRTAAQKAAAARGEGLTVPPIVQAKWDEIHAELQRRLEAIHARKAQGFELRPIIRGEGGIPHRVEWEEKDRQQAKRP